MLCVNTGHTKYRKAHKLPQGNLCVDSSIKVYPKCLPKLHAKTISWKESLKYSLGVDFRKLILANTNINTALYPVNRTAFLPIIKKTATGNWLCVCVCGGGGGGGVLCSCLKQI